MIPPRGAVPDEAILDLVVLGNATVDDLVFRDGTTRMGQPGGNAVYAAHGALLWGVRVGICVVVGNDYPRGLLAAEHLDLGGVQEVSGPSLRNWGLYEEDGTCQYIFRSAFGPEAHERYSPLAGGIPPSYREVRYAHLAPVPYARTIELLDTLHEVARRGGVSVDPDVRYLAALSPQERDGLLQRLTFFLPSLREAALIYPGCTAREVLQRVRQDYPNTEVAVVKLAADGCLVYDRWRDMIVQLPAAPATVVDTTGAGDAFCGGFLAGYALTGDGIQAAMHGIVSASFIVETYGIPRPGEIPVDAPAQRLAAYQAAHGHEIGVAGRPATRA